jgi:hypothetical protein
MKRVLLFLVLAASVAFAQDVPEGVVVLNSYSCWLTPANSMYEEYGQCFELAVEMCEPDEEPRYEGVFEFYNGEWLDDISWLPLDCEEEEEEEEEPMECDPDGADGMACEETLQGVRDALTNPDGLNAPPSLDSSSRLSGAWASLVGDVTAKLNGADFNASDKFPFGYHAMLATADVSATGCNISGSGSGLGSVWQYCSSDLHNNLAPIVKTSLAGLVWIGLALGLNARWSAAV